MTWQKSSNLKELVKITQASLSVSVSDQKKNSTMASLAKSVKKLYLSMLCRRRESISHLLPCLSLLFHRMTHRIISPVELAVAIEPPGWLKFRNLKFVHRLVARTWFTLFRKPHVIQSIRTFQHHSHVIACSLPELLSHGQQWKSCWSLNKTGLLTGSLVWARSLALWCTWLALWCTSCRAS